MASVNNRMRTMQFWYPNIPRKLVMANGLSMQAKFVYIYMSCQSETFEFYHEPMSNELGIGTRTLKKYIDELLDSGWITRNGQKFRNGRLGPVDYTVNTSPKKVKKENTDVQKTACSNSAVSKSATKYNSNTSIPITHDSNTSIPINKDNGEVDNKLSPNNSGSSRFNKPTIAEIEEYIKQKGYHIDAEYFYNYYEGCDWKRRKTKITKWKSVLATWEHQRKQENKEEPAEEAQSDLWQRQQEWFRKNVPNIASYITRDVFRQMRKICIVQWAFQQVLVKMNDGFEGDFLEAFKKEVKLCTGG
jgi:hypothetical protein